MLLAFWLIFPTCAAPDISTAITAHAASVKISRTTVTLIKGKSTTLSISGTKQKVTWSSSDKSIATVDQSGKVTGIKKGTVTVTAKTAGKALTCKVKVNNRLGASTNTVSLKEAAKDIYIYCNGTGTVYCAVEDPTVVSCNWKTKPVH